MFPRTIKETAIILLIAIVLAAGSYLLRPGALPLIKRDAAATPGVADDALFKPITIEHAEALFQKGHTLFADARSLIAFEQHHIPGALHLDPHEMDQWSDEMMTRYPPDQIIITYCDGANCDLSKTLAEKLTWLGFEQVFYLSDGWAQWQKRGLPIE
jgi:rhodanese-related sulfurtransferase